MENYVTKENNSNSLATTNSKKININIEDENIASKTHQINNSNEIYNTKQDKEQNENQESQENNNTDNINIYYVKKDFSLILKNLDILNESGVSAWISEDYKGQNLILREILDGLNKETIKQNELEVIMDKKLLKKIKIIYINNEIENLKFNFLESIKGETNEIINIEEVLNTIINYNINTNKEVIKLGYEELLFNIYDESKRIKIEKDIIKYNENQILYIHNLEEKLKEDYLTKLDIIKEIRYCKREMAKFKFKDFLPQLQKSFTEIFKKYRLKLQDIINNLPKDFQKRKENYLKKKYDDKIAPFINERYENYSTILHIEAKNNENKDYIEEIMSLIKLGANTTLRDEDNKTYIDYIPDNMKEKYYLCLKDSYKKGRNKNAENLRLLKAIIQYEWFKEEKTESITKYFDNIYEFVRDYIKRKKNMESLNEILSIHICHDEDSKLRQKREQYFENRLQKNQKEIEANFYCLNHMNLMVNIKGKYVNTDGSEMIYIKRKDKLSEENKIIRNYLLDDSNDEFKELKQEIEDSFNILNNNDYGSTMNSLLKEDIKNFIKEYPSQIYMKLSTGKYLFDEIIYHKNLFLIKLFLRYGRSLDYYINDSKLPLEIAVEENSTEFAKELIKLGASLNVRTIHGQKLYEIIYESNKDELKDFTNKYLNPSDLISYTSTHSLFPTESNEDVFEQNLYFDNNKNSLEELIIFDNNDNKLLNKSYGINFEGERSKNSNFLVRSLIKCQLENETFRFEMEKFISLFKKNIPNIKNIIIKNYFILASEYLMTGEIKKFFEIVEKYPEVLKYNQNNKLNLLSQIIITLESDHQFETFEGILKKNPEIINNLDYATNNTSKNTPIHLLMEKIRRNENAISILERLLPFITNPKILEFQNNQGMTVFDYGLLTNKINAVKLLFKKYLELRDLEEESQNVIHIQYLLMNENTNLEILKNSIGEILSLIEGEEERKKEFIHILNDNQVCNKKSPLHMAIYLVERIKLKQNVDNTNFQNNGPLNIYPINENRISDLNEIINYLINHPDINLDIKDEEGRSPLFYAILYKNDELVVKLIIKNKNVLFSKDNNEATPLHYVVLSGNITMAKKIVDNAKIILNRQDSYGRTVLHYSAINRNIEMLNFFSKHPDVLVDIEDDDTFRAIDYLLLDSLDDNIIEIIKELLKRKDKCRIAYPRNELHTACQNKINPEEVINLIIEEKSDQLPELVMKSISSATGKTPIEMSLENNISKDIIIKLIKKGKVLESKKDGSNEKEKLIRILLKFNREDIAEALGILKEYNSYPVEYPFAELIITLLKYLEEDKIADIKELLNMPSYINCSHFKSYDYAIATDRYDLFKVFVTLSDNPNLELIKQKLVKYNATNIINGLLNDGNDIYSNDLWSICDDELKDIYINYYKEEKKNNNSNTIENENQLYVNEINVDKITKFLENELIPFNGLLHMAAKKNSIELARVVLNKASINGLNVFEEKDVYLQTASDVALKEKNIDILVFFIMKGWVVEEIKDNLFSPMKMLMNEQIRLAKKNYELIHENFTDFKIKVREMSLEIINKQDILGNTLLFYAIEEDIEKVRELIKRGADVNIINKFGETPLVYAIKYAKSEIVEYLIGIGSNIEIMHKGKSMLHYAFQRRCDNGGKECETKNSVALSLIERGVIDFSPSTINCLLRYDDETLNYRLITPLMYNILKGNKCQAKSLIESEWINIIKPDSNGVTAYGYAKSKGYHDLINLMIHGYKDSKFDPSIEKDLLGLSNSKLSIKVRPSSLLTILGISSETVTTANDGSVKYDLLYQTIVDEKELLLQSEQEIFLENIQYSKNIGDEGVKVLLKIKKDDNINDNNNDNDNDNDSDNDNSNDTDNNNNNNDNDNDNDNNNLWMTDIIKYLCSDSKRGVNESSEIKLKEDNAVNIQQKVLPMDSITILSSRIPNYSSSFNNPNFSYSLYDNRDRQLDAMDVYGEVGRKVDEKGWLPNYGKIGEGDIYACTIYIDGIPLTISGDGEMLKIGKELYITNRLYDDLIKILKDRSIFVKELKEIFNSKIVEEELNDKGLSPTYKIERIGNGEGESNRLEVYYHLESIILYGTPGYFYTNRLQQELYIITSEEAVRIKNYGFLIFSKEGIVKNLKLNPIYNSGEVLRNDVHLFEKYSPWLTLEKENTDIEIEISSLLEEKLINRYLHLIPTNDKNERDENGKNGNGNEKNNNDDHDNGRDNPIIIELLHSPLKLLLATAGQTIKNSMMIIRKREFLQSLLILNNRNTSLLIDGLKS
ncbi:ankyrin repeat-containing domain protein [Neocallimastix sp. 'constans']